MTVAGLENSIPANNSKIIEIFNKLRTNQIIVNSDYQRKLVWKRQHKFDFISTILKNYPFPEVYLAPGSLDQEKLILVDEVVDGQQRLTTIRDYIDGRDVFSLEKIPIKKFSELTPDEKSRFLNYEVSIRYLKNALPDQIREIFQRINRTDYALNKVERLNAQWGESEFVCFCKQIVEKEFDAEGVQYILHPENRKIFLAFFHGNDDDMESVFSLGDNNRMLALQYVMTLIVTLDVGDYFNRNDKVQNHIEVFNDAFPQANGLEARLREVLDFIESLQVPRHSRWFNKANLFSLIVELDSTDRKDIAPEILGAKLQDFDYRATLTEFGINEENLNLNSEELRYLDLAREAVNQKSARDFRGTFLQKIFDLSRI